MSTSYANLQEFITQHKAILARQLAQTLFDTHLLPPEINLEEIIPFQETWLDTIAGYLVSGDINSVSTQIKTSTRAQVAAGFTTDYLQTTNTIFYTGIKALVEQELNQPEQAITRQQFLRRIESIRTLSSIAISTALI
jgi:hypothetical protein